MPCGAKRKHYPERWTPWAKEKKPRQWQRITKQRLSKYLHQVGLTRPTPLGINLVSPSVGSADIADWILPQHRLPLAIVLAMSYPGWEKDREGFIFVNDPQLKTVRVGVWRKPGPCTTYLVGLRATGIGQPGGLQDLADDAVVGGYNLSKTSCQINIVSEGRRVLDRLINQLAVVPSQILVAGYSLGGTAALCLGSQFPGVRAVSFSGGAPPTFPLRTGPGPSRATHYTVVGDLISSHVDPRAARIIRVDKGYGGDWGILIPHLSGRFLRNDRPPGTPGITADQADDLLVAWAAGMPKGPASGWRIAGTVVSTLWKLGEVIAAVVAPPVAVAMEGLRQSAKEISKAVTLGTTIAACTNAIPGSRRDQEGTCGMTNPSEAAKICQEKAPWTCLVDAIKPDQGLGPFTEEADDQEGDEFTE